MDNNIIRIINNEMSPRFGHTITLISKAGEDGHFSINSDTFLYLLDQQKWIKLNRKKKKILYN